MSKTNFKFRCYDTKRNKWLYDYKHIGGFDIIGEHVALGALSDIPLYRLKKDIEITMFTGLSDANGFDIYQGDIIEYTEHENYIMKSFTAEVVYDYSHACFGYKVKIPYIEDRVDSEKDFYIIPFSSFDEIGYDFLPYCKIIGNVFENDE